MEAGRKNGIGGMSGCLGASVAGWRDDRKGRGGLYEANWTLEIGGTVGL